MSNVYHLVIQPQMVNKTPILLITYRRSIFLNDLLKKIEKYQYKKIYVYSNFWKDNPLDKKDVNKVRELLIKFSKESEITIIFNFSEIHLPVDKSITNAISWFFTHEEEGIILEDDVGINSVSLEFISKGLEIYRDSNNIASVSAFTEYEDYEKKETIRLRKSFMFHSWGWGTWKKIWIKFNLLEKSNYLIDKEHQIFKSNIALRGNYQNILNKCLKREIVTWDYQFQNFCFSNNYINMIPTFPLIENYGIGDKFAENCVGDMIQTKKINLNDFSSVKIDYIQPIELNIKKEINLFKSKFPSLRLKIVRKFQYLINKFIQR